MNTAVMNIFNQLTGQYSSSISGIQTGSLILAKELFNNIALISIGLLGINHLLKKNVDMVDANFELVRWLIYLDMFYLFITQYNQWLPLIINSFQQAGSFLGGEASSSYVTPSSGSIISNGFNIALKILSVGLKQTMLLNLGATIVTVIAAVVVLYCFGRIAVDLLLVQIGSQIILAGGIFLLAFSGLTWTRDYAERYIHTFFQMGIKMMFMFILIGLGMGLTNNWVNTLNGIPANQTFQSQFAIVMATYVFYMLCQKLPEQASVYLCGRMSMAFDPIPALPAMVKGAVGLGKKVVESSTKFNAGMQGYDNSLAAARQLASTQFTVQGKTPTDQELWQATIKTLGEARRGAQQADWEKTVDDTEGGKLAKSILAEMPPAPAPTPAPEPETKA